MSKAGTENTTKSAPEERQDTTNKTANNTIYKFNWRQQFVCLLLTLHMPSLEAAATKAATMMAEAVVPLIHAKEQAQQTDGC